VLNSITKFPGIPWRNYFGFIHICTFVMFERRSVVLMIMVTVNTVVTMEVFTASVNAGVDCPVVKSQYSFLCDLESWPWAQIQWIVGGARQQVHPYQKHTRNKKSDFFLLKHSTPTFRLATKLHGNVVRPGLVWRWLKETLWIVNAVPWAMGISDIALVCFGWCTLWALAVGDPSYQCNI